MYVHKNIKILIKNSTGTKDDLSYKSNIWSIKLRSDYHVGRKQTFSANV